MSHTALPGPQVLPSRQSSSNGINTSYAPDPSQNNPLPPTIGFKPPNLGFDLCSNMPLAQLYCGVETLAPELEALPVSEAQSQFYPYHKTKLERRLSDCPISPPPVYVNHPSSYPSSPRRPSLHLLPKSCKQGQNQTSHQKAVNPNATQLKTFPDSEAQNEFYPYNAQKLARRLSYCPIPPPAVYVKHKHPSSSPSSPRRASLHSLPHSSKQGENRASHQEAVNPNAAIPLKVSPSHQSSIWVKPYLPDPSQNNLLPPTTGFKPPSLGFDLGPHLPLPQSYYGVETLAPQLKASPVSDAQSEFYPYNAKKLERRSSYCPISPPAVYVNHKHPSSSPSSPRRASLQSLPHSSKQGENQTSYHKDVNPNSTIPPKKSPTVTPAHPFNSAEDAEILKNAMQGLRTDEKTILNLLTKRSRAQRLEIALTFKTLYGKYLIKEMKNELSGNFERTIVALTTPLRHYYVRELHNAIVGFSNHKTVLIEVLCTLTNTEIRAIRETYQRTYQRNLESDIRDITCGDFQRLMVTLCSAGRDESMVTSTGSASADAQTLFNAGKKQWGTVDSTFYTILCERNHAQLQLVFHAYLLLTGHDIEKLIEREFSDDIQEGFLAVIHSIKNQQVFFAKRLHKSMQGVVRNDRDLIRLVVTRCEVDMGDIKKEYNAAYQHALADAIQDNTSGDYTRCLLALIGEL